MRIALGNRDVFPEPNLKKVHEILKIPEEYEIITLLIIGKRSVEIPEYFKDYQVKSENERPKRKALDEILFHNQYKEVV